MTLGRNERTNSTASTRDESSSYSSGTFEYHKTPSWASMSFAEPNRRLEPVESAAVAFEDQFSGWLWMRGTKFGRWRHRYFCLNGAVLSYFITFPSEEFLKQSATTASSSTASLSSPAASAAKKFQHLTHGSQPRGVVRIAHVDETDNRLGFKIYGTCGKKIDIRAHRIDERNDWLRVLKTPARRKSRSWSAGSVEEITMSLASFDSDLTCTIDRQSIPILKSGWLLKKSDVLKRWNRYFFVVQDKMISYYASEKPYEVPRRRGYIQNVQVVRSDQEHELQIRLTSNQLLHVRLSCEQDLEEWRETLLESMACRQTRSVSLTP
uniref:PH domain-containing protein n=1 Tax=Globisporangium ultimum (strain ATCC 200006 / CBS 805.95 / DAOM BR144) TaxID=431595 RepID=K3W5M0_GLOUD